MELARQTRAEHRDRQPAGRPPARRRPGRSVLGPRFRHGRDPPAQLGQQQQRNRTRHREQRQSRPQHPGHGGHTREQQRTGEGPHLVQRLVDGEATATTGGRRHPRQQRRLGRTAHRLTDPLEQDQRRRHRDPGNTQQRGDGQQRDADGRHRVPDHGQLPVPLAPVGPRAAHQPQDQRDGFTGPGHQADRQRGSPERAQQRAGHRAHALVDHVSGQTDQAERHHHPPRRP